MFTELEPVLADRSLLLTIAREQDGLLRVNVIPKTIQAGDKEKDKAEKALLTPLTIVGSAAELDRDLPQQLAQFTTSFLNTRSTLLQLRESHQAAVKEVEAENKKALNEKRKSSAGSKAASTTKPDNQPTFKDSKPVLGTKNFSGSLFDPVPGNPMPADGKTAAKPVEDSGDDLEA